MELSNLLIVRWASQSRVYTSLAGLVLMLCMTMGLLSWLGIPASYVRLTSELIALLMIGAALPQSMPRRLLTVALSVLPLGIVWAFGSIVAARNGAGVIQMTLFSREILTPVLFFVAFTLKPLERKNQNILLSMLVVLAVVQVVVAAMKFGVMGANEKDWIGTMHQTAGQLGLLMPLLALGYIWAFALVKRRCLLPMAMAIAIGFVAVASEKRALIVLVPMVPIGLFILYRCVQFIQQSRQYRLGCWFVFRYFLAAGISAAVLISLALSSIQSLQPKEFKQLGVKNVFEYVEVYLTRDYDAEMNASRTPVDENPNTHMGRLLLIKEAIAHAIESSWDQRLFGMGGGALLEHPALHQRGTDIMYHQVGLRGPNGLGVRHLLELGFVGTGLVIGWIGMLVVVLLVQLTRGGNPVLVFGALSGLGVLVFDYIVYSEIGWNSGVFMPVLMFLISQAMVSNLTPTVSFGRLGSGLID